MTKKFKEAIDCPECGEPTMELHDHDEKLICGFCVKESKESVDDWKYESDNEDDWKYGN